MPLASERLRRSGYDILLFGREASRGHTLLLSRWRHLMHDCIVPKVGSSAIRSSFPRVMHVTRRAPAKIARFDIPESTNHKSL